MDQELLRRIKKLRQELHQCPELSGCEKNTKDIIKKFLYANTSVEIVDRGNWFYAVHREDSTNSRTSKYYDGNEKEVESILFRADMDAIAGSDGKTFHGCGHDGHCSAIAGLAAALEGVRTGKNIYFLFQHGEENGTGAKECVSLIKKHRISKIYGFHNIPGFKENEILLIDGQFACASKGMTIRVHGHQSHAAYPEDGVNPAYLIGQLVVHLKEIRKRRDYYGMVMATIVHIEVGDKTFGIAAGEGEISLTLRAEYGADLDLLEQRIMDIIEQGCEEQGMSYDVSYVDEFPDTTNDHALFEQALRICWHKYEYKELDVPMRWSEDFGWYTKAANGLYVGIGAGENWPGLHTEQYEFNDNILETTISFLEDLAKD